MSEGGYETTLGALVGEDGAYSFAGRVCAGCGNAGVIAVTNCTFDAMNITIGYPGTSSSFAADGRTFAKPVVVEDLASLAATSLVLPEGALSIAVFSAPSITIPQSEKDASGNRWFVSGGTLRHGRTAFVLIVC